MFVFSGRRAPTCSLLLSLFLAGCMPVRGVWDVTCGDGRFELVIEERKQPAWDEPLGYAVFGSDDEAQVVDVYDHLGRDVVEDGRRQVEVELEGSPDLVIDGAIQGGAWRGECFHSSSLLSNLLGGVIYSFCHSCVFDSASGDETLEGALEATRVGGRP